MAYIYNLTDTWNAAGTVFTAISMDVTDTASAAGSKVISLKRNGTERLGLDKDGNLSIAGSAIFNGVSTAFNGFITGSDLQGYGRLVAAGSALYLQSGNSLVGTILPNSIVFGNVFGGAGAAVHPAGDNVQNLGLGSFRWAVVYAGTGTINTSDEREKEWRGGLNEAELRAAKRIVGELGFYRWIDAIAAKGDAARLHFGARAQQVWSIMADEGLVEPITDGIPGITPYAFLCFDQWDEAEAVTDSDGNELQPSRQAGNRFGLRVDQLVLFVLAAQEQRIAVLEKDSLL